MSRIPIAVVSLSLAACGQQQKKVDTAFEAMRAGRGTGFEDVIAMGDAAIPPVTRYLKDRDEGMRSQAVSVLAVIGTQAACDALAAGMLDASPANRDSTARALYRRCQKYKIPASAAGPLRAMVTQGTGDAEAILLLSEFPGPETRAALDTVSRQQKEVHLEGGLAVPAPLAVAVASGDGLGDRTKSSDLAERLFLLAVVGRIHSLKDVSGMLSYLDDQREIAEGMPSHSRVKRRLCDAALEALAHRAGWKPPFALDGSRRYMVEEIRLAKDALAKAFP